MSKKTLVLGASLNPERYSYKVIKMLKDKMHEVNALGLKSGKFLVLQQMYNKKHIWIFIP